MSVFDVDYDSLVKQLFPVRLRQPRSVAWLKCLVIPVKWLYGLFKTNRNNNLYILAHSSQVCYLEAALNDTFDPLSRGIYITDPSFFDPQYLYLVAEAKPLFIDTIAEIGTSIIPLPDPVPLFLNSETYSIGGLSFIINVPAAIYAAPTFDINRMDALVNLYKLVGRTYSVVPY